MQIPTRLVRRVSDGHVCLINAADFDPARHQDASAPPTPTPEPAAKPAQDAPTPEAEPEPASATPKKKGKKVTA
jgi:hypothetical protein